MTIITKLIFILYHHHQKQRLEDYLDVIRESNDTEAAASLGASITEIANNIIVTEPDEEILGKVYEVLIFFVLFVCWGTNPN